MSKYRP